MTDEEAKDLGLRALKAGFRWGVEGVLYRTGPGPHEEWRCYAGVDAGDPMGPWFISGEGEVYGAEEPNAPLAMIFNPWPDLRDPATLGVLVALVRERSGALLSPVATVGLDNSPGWTLDHPESPVMDALDIGHHATEAHALVAALEALDD